MKKMSIERLPDDPLERVTQALERIANALERQAATCVSTIEPAALSKEDAAKFIGEDVAPITGAKG